MFRATSGHQLTTFTHMQNHHQQHICIQLFRIIFSPFCLLDSLIMQTNRLLKSFMNPRFAGSVAYRPSAATTDCYHFQTTENATVCKHTYKAAPGLNSVSHKTTFCVTARQGYRIRNLPVSPLHNISEAYRKTMLHICAPPLLQRQEV